jgi:GntR family transcriptional regulator, transcriptional repressor for pyruvate dehydrogenase complex
VALRRNAEVVPALREALAAEATALEVSQEEYVKAGSNFHDLLTQLSGNTTLGVIAGTLNAIFDRHMMAVNLPKAPDQHLNSQRAHRTHLQLVDLIEQGNGEGAEKLWAKHHQHAAQVILHGHGSATIADLHLD